MIASFSSVNASSLQSLYFHFSPFTRFRCALSHSLIRINPEPLDRLAHNVYLKIYMTSTYGISCDCTSSAGIELSTNCLTKENDLLLVLDVPDLTPFADSVSQIVISIMAR